MIERTMNMDEMALLQSSQQQLLDPPMIKDRNDIYVLRSDLSYVRDLDKCFVCFYQLKSARPNPDVDW